VVIGAVLSKGAKADYVVTESMVRTMRPGFVLVDVSIDQGGCFETSRPTSHSADDLQSPISAAVQVLPEPPVPRRFLMYPCNFSLIFRRKNHE
jgi:hypothetical protein